MVDQIIANNLKGCDQLIFLDMDNWSRFFHRLPGNLPERTFVWIFYGESMNWKEPTE
jgi:PIN like domain